MRGGEEEAAGAAAAAAELELDAAATDAAAADDEDAAAATFARGLRPRFFGAASASDSLDDELLDEPEDDESESDELESELSEDEELELLLLEEEEAALRLGRPRFFGTLVPRLVVAAVALVGLDSRRRLCFPLLLCVARNTSRDR